MKIKSILIILLTASLTLLMIQNSEPISMKFFWQEFQFSKLILILVCFIIGLIVGILIRGFGARKPEIEISDSELSEEDRTWLGKE